VPAWAAVATTSLCFLVVNPTANKFLSSSGQFNAKLNFLEGLPINQSKSLVQPMKNFFASDKFTALIRGNSWAKDKTIADFTYGLDHERLVIRCNVTTGYLSATFYPKSASNVTPTPVTLTTTTDVSGATFSDIGVNGRFMNDGADYLTLYVNGISVGSLTAQSFLVSNDWRDLGTAWIGGGFPLAPTWTVDTDMSVLPSAAGWTWTGTATEANATSVSGGKLYQNSNGYASTQSGYYSRVTTLNNTTGWCVEWKGRIVTDLNTPNNANGAPVSFQLADGSKRTDFYFHEYFIQSGIGAAIDFTVQGDFKSVEHVYSMCGKGSDYYLFVDGKLAIDGTGKLSTTSAANTVVFSDIDGVLSANNADVIYDYVKIYNGGMLTPQASTGASLSEFAYWSADKSALLPLAYNSGTPISIKQLCGVSKNYVGEGAVFTETRLGVTTFSTTSTTPVLLPEMESFIIGNKITQTTDAQLINSAASVVNNTQQFIDGVLQPSAAVCSTAITNGFTSHFMKYSPTLTLGLHKVESKAFVSAGTMSEQGVVFTGKGHARLQTVSAKP
jgi:hypothetical protein